MSEQEGETFSVNLTIYEGNDGGSLRQVGLGLQPIILIEPEEDENGNIVFEVHGSLIGQDEMAMVFEALADTLKNGKEA